jgi:hypothetical protein
MKTVKFSGVIENAYGKKLEAPITFEAEFEAFENKAEVEKANELLKDEEIVDFRNAQRKANARQKAMQAALDAAKIEKPTLENDPDLRLRKMYDIFVANGSTHEEARANAATALNLTWSD